MPEIVEIAEFFHIKGQRDRAMILKSGILYCAHCTTKVKVGALPQDLKSLRHILYQTHLYVHRRYKSKKNIYLINKDDLSSNYPPSLIRFDDYLFDSIRSTYVYPQGFVNDPEDEEEENVEVFEEVMTQEEGLLLIRAGDKRFNAVLAEAQQKQEIVNKYQDDKSLLLSNFKKLSSRKMDTN